MLTIPGSYYYKTRYSTPAFALAHIIKTWLLPTCILWIACNNITLQTALITITSILGFQAIYDFFSYQNDHSSILHESEPTYRNHQIANPPAIRAGLVIYPIITILSIALLSPYTAALIALIYLTVATVFYFHNSLPDKTTGKLITFYALYVTKYTLLVASLNTILTITTPVLIILFIFPLLHLPAYAAKKIAFFKILSRAPSPTVLKSFILLLLAPSNILYLIAATAFILTTSAEFFLGRRKLLD